MSSKIYLDASCSTAERVQDLMERMTLEEKVRQLGCAMAMGTDVPAVKMDVAPGIGEIAVMGGGETPEKTAAYIRNLQEYIIENSPHHIPAIFHCEALSGPVVSGTNLFPTSISLGAAFNPKLVRDMCERTRKQMLGLGIRQALSPVLDVTLDLRWGRTGETYGGDPTHISAMSCAFVEGLQSPSLSQGVAATAKHFLGYSATEGGLNMARTMATKRDIREIFAKPFEAAIRKSHIASIMNSYSELDGVPICASSEILDELLRKELGFKGVVVSDYMSIPRLVTSFHTAEDMTDAAIQCLEAGLDVECPMRTGYSDEFIEAAKAGRIDQSFIDRSVERVLTLKFDLGLFENPYPRQENFAEVFDNTENNHQSLAAARQTMTLTKNDGILPITDKKKKIAVIGPSADSMRLLYSCYTYPPMLEMLLGASDAMAGVSKDAGDLGGASGMKALTSDMAPVDAFIRSTYPEAKTIREALAQQFSHVAYAQGCNYNSADEKEFQQAIDIAKEADVVILTLCGKNGWGLHCTTGEGVDSSSLDLPGAQEELMREVYRANPNMVIVHTDARPLVSEWAYDHAKAILEAWLPCTYGGIAIAETLYGTNVPAGRLPVDVPRSVGHTPCYHYQHNGSSGPSFAAGALNNHAYIDSINTALRPFGHGLSYTSFSYSDFSLLVDEAGTATASVWVKNTGGVAGDEVVQLYGSDVVASIVRPQQELIGFYRVALAAGEKKKVVFEFNLNQLAFYDASGNWILEKGDFAFFVGASSAAKLQEATYKLKSTRTIDPANRGFFADTSEAN